MEMIYYCLTPEVLHYYSLLPQEGIKTMDYLQQVRENKVRNRFQDFEVAFDSLEEKATTEFKDWLLQHMQFYLHRIERTHEKEK